MAKPRDRRSHGFESMGNILHDVLAPYKSEFGDKLETLVQKWPQIAGGVVAAHSRPFAVKGQKLFVKADSAAWLHHLQFLKDDLLAKINAETDGESVTDIHFKVKDMS